MGANKIASCLVQYRSKRKEAAEEEKRRRIEDAQRRPPIIDPSFELFGHDTPPSAQSYDGYGHDAPSIIPAPASDDWLFQTRGASTSSHNHQLDPYCEITPKSSVSSQNSAISDASSSRGYNLGPDTVSTARPRPQSYLPPTASASYSSSLADLHRSTEYKPRRRSAHIGNQQGRLPFLDRSQQSQPGYRLEASLTRPFSIDEPLEFLSEPSRDSHLYHQSSVSSARQIDTRLSSIPEHNDDLIKRGYII